MDTRRLTLDKDQRCRTHHKVNNDVRACRPKSSKLGTAFRWRCGLYSGTDPGIIDEWQGQFNEGVEGGNRSVLCRL